MVKNLPAMQETRVQSLDWEDPLEKGMVTHSSILALENSMDRRAWRATIHGVTKELDMTHDLHFHFGSLWAVLFDHPSSLAPWLCFTWQLTLTF